MEDPPVIDPETDPYIAQKNNYENENPKRPKRYETEEPKFFRHTAETQRVDSPFERFKDHINNLHLRNLDFF